MIRSFRLAALAALTLGAASSADAAFSYTATVQTVTVGSSTTNILTGNTASIGGVTVTFANDSASGLNTVVQTSSIGVALSGSYTATTPSTGPITVTSLITFNSGTATTSFTETTVYNLFNSSASTPSSTYSLVSGGSVIAPQLGSAPPYTFTVFNANATSATDSKAAQITGTFTVATSAVPEPASVAMLGLGLVGTVGFAARRRRAA